MKAFLFVQAGKVLQGSGKARVLGYPTANIAFECEGISGTYAGKVLFDGKCFEAAVYADPIRKLLEAHLFDFSGNLYGKEIQISLLKQVALPAVFTPETDVESFLRNVVGKVEVYFKRN